MAHLVAYPYPINCPHLIQTVNPFGSGPTLGAESAHHLELNSKGKKKKKSVFCHVSLC